MNADNENDNTTTFAGYGIVTLSFIKNQWNSMSDSHRYFFGKIYLNRYQVLHKNTANTTE